MALAALLLAGPEPAWAYIGPVKGKREPVRVYASHAKAAAPAAAACTA